MAIHRRHHIDPSMGLRDIRPTLSRIADGAREPMVLTITLVCSVMLIWFLPWLAEFTVMACAGYVWWFRGHKIALPLKLPKFADRLDPNNAKPGGGAGQADGILFVGNDKFSDEEMWLTNSDARTHILYLGTTGAGKTEGLKSLVTNSLTWGSGFIYIDGKADTDLWAAMFSLARRFGRDDDLLVLNYMTGNSDGGAPSNSLNPFSSGSASYLTNLMVSLMDEAGGDNAMWKGRAISLMSSLMPALTWQRDNRGLLLDVSVVRDALNLSRIVQFARDEEIPARIRRGINGYLRSLPGFLDEAFDDEGNAQVGPDGHAHDISIPAQQHGYLEMQFTRGLQSLGDEYGYIFSSQIADIDMLDVVLNRRILVCLIPALEKSADEAANLGKIIAASIKGMMGATLGADVEGDWDGIIENKPTRASSPFMTVFDEVGYYAAEGMAVMAAQARSLGFSLIFAAQDLPALEKRVKDEAKSIVANCNLKLFGKLEDSRSQGDTKEFFERTVGTAFIGEMGNFTVDSNSLTMTYQDAKTAQIAEKPKARFSELKNQKEGEVHLVWRSDVMDARMFYAAPKKIKAIRVQKFLPVSPEHLAVPDVDNAVDAVLDRLTDEAWTAAAAGEETAQDEALDALQYGFELGQAAEKSPLLAGALGVASLSDALLRSQQSEEGEAAGDEAPGASPPAGDAAAQEPVAAAPAVQEPALAPAEEIDDEETDTADGAPAPHIAPVDDASGDDAVRDAVGEQAPAPETTSGAAAAMASDADPPDIRAALPLDIVPQRVTDSMRAPPMAEARVVAADIVNLGAIAQPVTIPESMMRSSGPHIVWVAPKQADAGQSDDETQLDPGIAAPIGAASHALARNLFAAGGADPDDGAAAARSRIDAEAAE